MTDAKTPQEETTLHQAEVECRTPITAASFRTSDHVAMLRELIQAPKPGRRTERS